MIYRIPCFAGICIRPSCTLKVSKDQVLIQRKPLNRLSSFPSFTLVTQEESLNPVCTAVLNLLPREKRRKENERKQLACIVLAKAELAFFALTLRLDCCFFLAPFTLPSHDSPKATKSPWLPRSRRIIISGRFDCFPEIRNRRLQQEALQHLIQLLPTPNRETLWALLNFLSVVAANSEDQKNEAGEWVPGNKMDTTNLATVSTRDTSRL